MLGIQNLKSKIGIIRSVLVAALLCLSCGGDGGEKPVGNSLVFAIHNEPDKLDPPNQTDNTTEDVIRHLYNNLVEFDENLNHLPGLAESWEVSPDAKTWTFHLRREVVFHDGTPFNADAVKYTLDRMLDTGRPTKRTSLYEPFIDTVRVVDEYTIAVDSEKPFGPMLAHMTHAAGAIISPTAHRKFGDDFGRNPVGTGPYRFVSWTAGDRVVLERNDGFWCEKPKIDRIEFVTVPEPSSRMIMLQKREANVALNIDPNDVQRLEDHPEVEISNAPANGWYYLGMNNQRPPYNDVRFRQALNHAVDKEKLVSVFLKGYGRVSDSLLAPANWGYAPIFSYGYDPERARQLLKEAGIPEGFTVKLWCPSGRYTAVVPVCEAIAGYLRDVGLKVDFQTFEWGTYIDMISKPLEETQAELFYIAHAPSTADADWGIRPMYYSKEWPLPGNPGNNRYFYANPKVDALIEQGMVTADREARRQVYADLQRTLVEDAPVLMLYEINQIVAYSRGLENLVISPLALVFGYKAHWSAP
ncbi:MAG: glutathione ABC transporter substrate-binding protein [candidate division Zixibacteria bacterium]|nr:glutathione ABC transporter substrate-binding protein [candidate division Zixibacteria bacterium]